MFYTQLQQAARDAMQSLLQVSEHDPVNPPADQPQCSTRKQSNNHITAARLPQAIFQTRSASEPNPQTVAAPWKDPGDLTAHEHHQGGAEYHLCHDPTSLVRGHHIALS